MSIVNSSHWSRREFLKLAGQAGLGLSLAPLARGADTVTISILHTTDLHGHILPTTDYSGTPDLGGMARCVTQIRRWQAENPNSILLDIGDIYQGTDVGLRTRGGLMVDLLNLVKYDAWIVGNHEFDWGIEPFLRALERSAMPVLASNTILEGKPPGEFSDSKHPFAKIRPWLMKEIAGIKVAVIGLTTPGMPFWFRPDFTEGMEFPFPVESVRRALRQAQGEGAHAIVLAGHMGLKERTRGDDFANTVMALTAEFPEAAVFIAGHTHKDIPSRLTNSVLFTQADHFGIHVGRVDLLFDRDTKKLLHQEARCELMDARFEPDPLIISRAQPQLAESMAAVARPIGELADTLSVRSHPGEPSDVEMLIGAAIMEAMRRDGTPVAGVLHGLFDEKNAFAAGPKTVEDIWSVLPYENYLVTGELDSAQLLAVMGEAFQAYEGRNLMGFEVRVEGRGKERRILGLTLPEGKPLEAGRRYRIAFNTFDSQSGGHRLMKLRDFLQAPEAKCTLHHVQAREALIDYFRRHKVVRRIPSARDLPINA